MNKEMIKIPNPKELTHKMSNSKMPQQIANAHPHNTDGREERTCLICKERKILSLSECVEEGWELFGQGMICGHCAEQQELLQYRGLPNCYKMPWMVK